MRDLKKELLIRFKFTVVEIKNQTSFGQNKEAAVKYIRQNPHLKLKLIRV